MASVLELAASMVVYVVEGPPSVGVSDGLSDGLGDGDAQGELEGLADGLALGDVLGEALALGEVLAEALALGEVLGEVLAEALGLGEPLVDALGDGHDDVEGEADGDPLGLTDALALGVGLSAARARASSRWASGSALSPTVTPSETGPSEPVEVVSGARDAAPCSVAVAARSAQLTDPDVRCGRVAASRATSMATAVPWTWAGPVTVARSADRSPSTRTCGAATDTVRCSTVRVTDPA
ncbi:hypothetical protein Psi02_11450 [Planotetraspora silvatica]|uniref:Uncharacterized protein n=1 Tax=Planotetraspora silvatica TaxID=234614 RepID=A0A8J3XM11_9ACTN|nr:hypothetical protein Psi02_11450 [Planotetraspora silvatica]